MVSQNQRTPGDQVFWPKVVLKKWLNLRSKDAKFNADEDDGDDDGEQEESCGCDGAEAEREAGGVDIAEESLDAAPYKLRRRNSETMRAQYISTKELRICIGTYNAAGIEPPEGLDIAEWLGTTGGEQADMYVLGFQEVVPLNAGNVLGAEDVRPALAWEALIRDTLTRTQPSCSRPKYRYRSHPATPTRDGSDELFPGGTDTDTDDDAPFSFPVYPEEYVAATPRMLGAMEDLEDEQPRAQQRALLKTMSKTDRIGLAWPEQPLDLMATASLSSASFKSPRSFGAHRSFVKSRVAADDCPAMVPDLDLDLDGEAARGHGKKKGGGRSPFVRIVSKQMVGVFLTIWVRRGLRRCVQNIKVSTVGVGAMGYIGNKGSVSASMSIYQTMFCFVCTHLSAGERPGNLLKRNADVQEIHRRTRFAGPGGLELPRDIYDHERIFWLGDLNYRIDVPYDGTHSLIAAMDWPQLAEKDQLKRELRKGRAFEGWSEGVLEFAPTYKYEVGTGKYIGDDQKGGRRTPAWCDRVLSFGKGVRLLGYGRSELTLSDHKPVTATYAAEVEVFCGRKLQRALTLTDAEVDSGDVVVPDLEF
ncbi:type IV inositol polyphosphate 5-phosphatase 3-like [Triticum urartu]|uniref:Inositol polyphosphate-related phosphatase domain-containing protein n=1 Tax=Triticum urartu TaxID=4572 RepID=A0A8R7TS53_TRIUA|nr:type IV inositol polyphosphate 5-phosphatase 3-like [Triticum urartu]XP_048562179.1 type IV inositol polyphosphate 5-phosphatase 3-like [Triticum urartu]